MTCKSCLYSYSRATKSTLTLMCSKLGCEANETCENYNTYEPGTDESEAETLQDLLGELYPSSGDTTDLP